jgi:chromosome segregation ATPase
MMSPAILVLLALGQVSHASATTLNPITRVVQLLEGLAKKVEQDGKMEEDLYDAYICWGTTVVKTKTATNEAAKARIEELEAYIDDIKSGRIEFTSERTDLEAAIKGLNEEIETAEDMRDKEKKDFEAAKDEMEKAIAALEEAVEVLGEATKEKPEGEKEAEPKEAGLLSIKRAVQREVQTFKEGEHTGAALALKNAIELGQRYLSKGDALFLQRVLSGEVPKADWKKLNRKATFKAKYKARSGKIQQILADMLQTFKTNLEDAIKKEKDAAQTHEDLMKSKNEELSGNEEALAAGEKEGAARGMNMEEAQKEVDDLKAQIEADTKFIADTEEALATKKEEWKERKKLRTLEIASINKAIAILNSDEARDTMKSSFKSQGYETLLLQKSEKNSLRQRAFQMIRKVEISAKDRRLATLRALLQAGEGPLDEVIKMIDEMVATLREEEAADLEKKETCEAAREKDTASARKLSLDIDDFTELMNRKTARIAELKAIIEEKEAEIKAMQEALVEATRKREDEKAAYEAAKADDEAAAKLIQQAKDVLEGFYKDNGLVFAQRGAQAPTNIEAGKAPPPPPTTWDAPYGGSKGEATGIQAILQMILEDVEADIKKADEMEKTAIEEYEKFKKDTEESIIANQKAIEDMKGEIADCEKAIEEAKESRISSKGELDSVMEKIKVDEPGCEFMTINFPVRLKNRQMEIDGLLKAKAILQGGTFNAGPDPNREIKPGDAM